MASPTNARGLVDDGLSVSATLPNAANTVNSNGIDLQTATPYCTTEQFNVKISLTAATGANNKNINIRLMDSADNSTFANVALFANPVLRSVDNNGAGHSAASVIFKLPPTIQRYIRATALGESNGGDSSDGTFNIKLLF